MKAEWFGEAYKRALGKDFKQKALLELLNKHFPVAVSNASIRNFANELAIMAGHNELSVKKVRYE